MRVVASAALTAGQNGRAIALSLAPWQRAVQGLGDAKNVQLVQESAGLRVECAGQVDAATGKVVCSLAPVGEVEVRTKNASLRLDTRSAR